MMWFGKGYTHMVSSAWSGSNVFFPVWGISYIRLFWKILSKLYLSMDYFGIKWTTMQMFLYLCMNVLKKKTFMFIHIYTISGQYEILFQWIVFQVLRKNPFMSMQIYLIPGQYDVWVLSGLMVINEESLSVTHFNISPLHHCTILSTPATELFD